MVGVIALWLVSRRANARGLADGSPERAEAALSRSGPDASQLVGVQPSV